MRYAFVILICLLSLAVTATPKRIWIDTDMMLGKARKDVDDGLALLFALQSEEVEIVGISLVVDVEYGFKVTQDLLQWYAPNKQIPVYMGAHSADERGQTNPAVEAMAKALMDGPLTMVSLGPATNLGTLLDLYPDAYANMEEVIFCKGRQPGVHFQPGGKLIFNDYNFELDVASVQDILATDVPIVLAGYQASAGTFFNMDDLAFLKESGSKSNKWLYKQVKGWRKLWRMFIGTGDKGFIPFDAVTIAYVIAPEMLQYQADVPVVIKEGENDTGRGPKTKAYLLADKSLSSSRTVTFCDGAKPELKASLLQRLQQITTQPHASGSAE